ncbi:16S rRNA (uracil(1498)-N(3))-methyltransferase [Mesobacillus maritimus]|uniref:16S rRNA (uracil(1498)-N(3))-methyltransferase n=1 Tax=Mesobacillus maritimus TaxID=1643336 RepID=UPI00203A5EF3|nr:16S rRNA (uracil(1498)-N(3))-methyltransferase [Mesobacillus maritimus]MCM3586280.1 16S rRNA (uracil(1498)-N(3))-methyltransferase [Mesobacillus maritimus]MCM3671676.1 16S rRNA (uracil(1498)-N(3))-methyltransferase [Mesobacillus maritimus]
MQRYFVNNPSEDGRFQIIGDDYHHLVRVMRMKQGDQIICVSPNGDSALCEIAEITADQAIADIVKWNEDSPELPIQITIASGLPKGDKLELIIQKGTELGAYGFIPFIAARSVVKWDEKKSKKKVERWQKIAKEAAEQSHRTKIPNVEEPFNFKELVELGNQFDYKLIAYEEEARKGEASVLVDVFSTMQPKQSLLVVFGPEGGLTEKEVAMLTEKGFLSCGLGPRILRTETAPLYLLSAASYHFELMR